MCQNYQNRLMCVEVIVQRQCVFLRHSVSYVVLSLNSTGMLRESRARPRGCNENATRKLFPWNVGYIETAILTSPLRSVHTTSCLLLLPFINTVDKTQLHTQNGNSKSHKIQKSVFTHDSLSLNNLVCYR